jgi:hypothetical protein
MFTHLNHSSFGWWRHQPIGEGIAVWVDEDPTDLREMSFLCTKDNAKRYHSKRKFTGVDFMGRPSRHLPIGVKNI